MASIYARGNRWWVKYHVPGEHAPRRESLGPDVRTRAQAREALRTVESRLAAKRQHRPPGLLRFAEILESFLAEKRATTEEWTWKTYEKHAKHFRRRLPVESRVSEIGPQEIAAYRDARLEDVGAQTVRHELTTLSTLWKYAIHTLEETETNPVLGVKPPSLKKTRPRACPPEIYESLRSAVTADLLPQKNKAGHMVKRNPSERWVRELFLDAIAVLWATGWRIGELCAIRPANVDTRAWLVEIPTAWNKDFVGVIPAAAQPVFERRLALAKTRKDEFVFAGFVGGSAYRPLEKFWVAWIAEHPDHELAHFHALRRAVKLRMKKRKVDPLTRRDALGHKTVRMDSHYTQEDLDDVRAALEEIAGD